MASMIPDKLTPVPQIDRSLLPPWISDVGIIEPDLDDPKGFFVMTAISPRGKLFHCDTSLAGVEFDARFWTRFAKPMVENLGGMLFEEEWPDMYGSSLRWEAEAAIGQRELNEFERRIISRRNELTWQPPA